MTVSPGMVVSWTPLVEFAEAVAGSDGVAVPVTADVELATPPAIVGFTVTWASLYDARSRTLTPSVLRAASGFPVVDAVTGGAVVPAYLSGALRLFQGGKIADQLRPSYLTARAMFPEASVARAGQLLANTAYFPMAFPEARFIPLHPPGKATYTGRLETPGFAPVDLRIESFQCSASANEPTLVSATSPAWVDLADAIDEREGQGDLVVYMVTDGKHYDEVARAALSGVRVDEGATASTATFTGYSAKEYPTPYERDLSGVSYRMADGVSRSYRCAMDATLRPGDVAVYGSDRVLIEKISYAVSPENQTMQITGTVDG